jgi:Na+/proline symporter
MVILVAGVVLCIFYAAEAAGGFTEIFKGFPAERGAALDLSHGVNDGSAAPFWAFLVGGVFLYTSYYGTDQSQVQRELSTTSETESRKSLLFNGFARFPLTLLYVGMGMALWAAHDKSPELAALVPAGRPDELVPQFILHFLPPGVRALIFASLMAAAMSSLDSALNSLSAVTVRDFIGRRIHDSRKLMIMGKLTTVAWGVLITAAAYGVGAISDTAIEAINKVGSAFYGPILAAFMVGVLSKRARPAGVMLGLTLGVGINLWFWLNQPGIHWMWWNVLGFAATTVVSLVDGMLKPFASAAVAKYTLAGSGHFSKERPWLWLYGLLVLYFFLMLLVVYAL